jgi:hypothetical protein
VIGCFDQRILASLCYAGMTARLQRHDIGLQWPVMTNRSLHGSPIL